MPFNDTIYTAGMTPQQRAWFFAEYEQANRNEIVGVLLAFFFGSLGLHHFYLRRNRAGILYLLFCWTGVPAILGVVEAFLMPGRVRAYNAAQAAFLADQIRGGPPAFYTPPQPAIIACPACGGSIESDASFCPHCGAARAA